jgi:hypothetical protein
MMVNWSNISIGVSTWPVFYISSDWGSISWQYTFRLSYLPVLPGPESYNVAKSVKDQDCWASLVLKSLIGSLNVEKGTLGFRFIGHCQSCSPIHKMAHQTGIDIVAWEWEHSKPMKREREREKRSDMSFLFGASYRAREIRRHLVAEMPLF